MFKRALLFSFLLFSCLIAASLALYLPLSTEDQHLFQEAAAKVIVVAQSKQPIHPQQDRWGVSKDLWLYQEDGVRLHHHIASKSSSLQFIKHEQKMVITEHLEKISCLIQDQITQHHHTPFQHIRTFEALQGSYDYHQHALIAHHAKLSFFKLPGKELPHTLLTKPYLTGVAKDISLLIKGRSPQFEATHFQAHFEEQGH
ncbi:MAG: hypothetical protein QRY72_03400 [Candidatus Rhabdochlamydia sp.]